MAAGGGEARGGVGAVHYRDSKALREKPGECRLALRNDIMREGNKEKETNRKREESQNQFRKII